MHYLIAEIEKVQDVFFILFLAKSQTEFQMGLIKRCLGMSFDSLKVLISN